MLDFVIVIPQHPERCIAQALNNNPCFEKVAGSKILWRLVPEGENVGDGDLQGGGLFSICFIIHTKVIFI